MTAAPRGPGRPGLQKGSAAGTTLWLMPQEGESQRRLADLIASLAQRLGTPRFEPHLTLLGGLEGSEADIVERTGALARMLRPIELHLHAIEGSDEYFRCVFVTVEPSPQ